MAPLPVSTLYVLAHVASAAVAAFVGLWVLRRTDVVGSRTFAALMAVDTAWVAASAAEVVAADPELVVAAAVARTVLSMTAVVVWFRFASVYGGFPAAREDPWTLSLLVGYVVLVGLVLTVERPSAVATTPFPHAVNRLTVFAAAGLTFSAVGIFGGIARLRSLFHRSRHRPSAAVSLLVVTAVAATLPRVAAELGFVPVPTFDHTALGVGFFTTGAALAVFGRGFLSIDPVARDVLFEDLGYPVVVVDGRDRVVDFNAGATSLCDALEAGDAVGRPYEAVCPTLAAAAPLSVLADDRSHEVTLRSGDEIRHFAVHRTPVSTGAGVGFALVFNDVTDLVTYRHELERQNEQLEQFAETVTHDLRNPLNVAQGYLELVADDVEAVGTGGDVDPETVRERVETAARAHERMREIVEDLQTLARKGQSVEATERLRLSEVVEAAWASVEVGDARLSVVRDGDVVADRSRLLSIFENLFVNCVVHAGRRVTVEVAASDGGFAVADDGVGIRADERDHVFEYGYTTSRRGSGLGLSIVRTMAESHGWTVTIDDSYVDGARFVFAGAVTTPDPVPGRTDADDGSSTSP